jgi:hypothetical protein
MRGTFHGGTHIVLNILTYFVYPSDLEVNLFWIKICLQDNHITDVVSQLQIILPYISLNTRSTEPNPPEDVFYDINLCSVV